MSPEYRPGPFDQRPTENREDVLVYTTGELKEDLEVTGQIKVHLWAISSAPDTDFVARLVDVTLMAMHRSYRRYHPCSLS